MLNKFHLSYFLLNIGGKSPLIICEDADRKFEGSFAKDLSLSIFLFIK